MKFLKKLVYAACVFLFGFVSSTSLASHNWDDLYDELINNISQNSINNDFWDISQWQNFKAQHKARFSSIHNKDDFFKAVELTLKDLGDNHSFLIRNTTQQEKLDNPKFESPKITTLNGVGVITLPTLMINNVTEQESLLLEAWVLNFQKDLFKILDQVKHGWVIDLRNNHGGNMYPMLAALSYFIQSSNIGGFYAFEGQNPVKQNIFFDGQSFSADGESFLSYSKKFKFGENHLPVTVLISSDTASSAEFVSLTLKRQPNIKLLGKPTYGLASANAALELPENLGFYMLTIGYYLDTDDNPLKSKIVIPDNTIDLTGDDLTHYAVRALLNS